MRLGISCLLYTSDAADDQRCVDLGGRRIIKKNFFQAEDGIRDPGKSRGLGDVYKRQVAEIEKKLCNSCFLRLGLGCLANPIHIQELTTNEVILQSGKHLPISRKYRAQFRSDYYRWMVGNIG